MNAVTKTEPQGHILPADTLRDLLRYDPDLSLIHI